MTSRSHLKAAFCSFFYGILTELGVRIFHAYWKELFVNLRDDVLSHVINLPQIWLPNS